MYFNHYVADKIDFCFRHFIFKFDARMTVTNVFQKVIKFSVSIRLDYKDVVYKTRKTIVEVCRKCKNKLFLKPTQKNICTARFTFSVHSATIFLEII